MDIDLLKKAIEDCQNNESLSANQKKCSLVVLNTVLANETKKIENNNLLENLLNKAEELKIKTSGDYEIIPNNDITFNRAVVKTYLLGSEFGKFLAENTKDFSIENMKKFFEEYQDTQIFDAGITKEAIDLYDMFENYKNMENERIDAIVKNLTKILNGQVLSRYNQKIIINENEKAVMQTTLKNEFQYEDCYKLSLIESEKLLSNLQLKPTDYKLLIDLLEEVFTNYKFKPTIAPSKNNNLNEELFLFNSRKKSS